MWFIKVVWEDLEGVAMETTLREGFSTEDAAKAHLQKVWNSLLEELRDLGMVNVYSTDVVLLSMAGSNGHKH